jgi:hypothetical protein
MNIITVIIATTGIIVSETEFIARTLDCLLRVLLAFRKHEVVVVAATKVKRLRQAVRKQRRRPSAKRQSPRRIS